MQNFPPRAFIVGSQKCGTTSLARLLDDNPDICLSNPKEPNYYSGNFDKGIDWYRNLFTDPEKILVDASTTYTMCPLSEQAIQLKPDRERQTGVPRRIHEDSPDAKIIYIVRDPVDRLYSNYWHNVKYGYEKKKLTDAIKDDPQYLHMSEYFGQIEKYLEYFPRDNILVIRFEDFVKNQQAVLNECERFIGAPQSVVQAARNENKSQQYSGLGKFLVKNPLTRGIDKYIPESLKAALKRLLTKEIPPLSPAQRKELGVLFSDDQEKLQAKFSLSYPTD